MELSIKNILGIKEATIDFKPGSTLITGKNSTGKTSIYTVLSALLAQNNNPFHVSAADQKWYVHDDAQEGHATMGGVKWQPKTGISAPKGQQALCTPYSVGLVDFCDPKSRKARQAIWEDLFLPDNPAELLKPVWTQTEKQLQAVLDKIEETGDWNKALQMYEDQRRLFKSKWCETTGSQRYGVKVAANWTPPNWNPMLDGESSESLQAELVDARDHLQSMMAVQAVSAAQIEEAQSVRDVHLPNATKERTDLQDRIAIVDKDIAEFRSKEQRMMEKINKAEDWIRKTKKVLTAVPEHYCPHCNEGVEMLEGQLIPWVKPSGEKLDEMRSKYDEVKEKLEKGKKNLKQVKIDNSHLSERKSKLMGEVHEKNGQIAMLKKRAAFADSEVASIDESAKTKAEDAVRRAHEKLDAFERRETAKAHHNNVVYMDEICELLGPNGARAVHIQECMSKIQKVLDRINSITGWLPIGLTNEYQVTSNDRPIQFCAKNERYKAQWALQVACAYYAKDNWILIDESDALRDESWEGLVRLGAGLTRKNNSLRVIVCATSSEIKGWHEVKLG